LAPANTPEPIINKLHTVSEKILSTAAVREKLAGLGMVVSPMPPAEFGAFIRSEITRWTAEAKAAGIEAK
jgi:tripartite-type tricarboxylate transporter receptor subunit TctC